MYPYVSLQVPSGEILRMEVLSAADEDEVVEPVEDSSVDSVAVVVLIVIAVDRCFTWDVEVAWYAVEEPKEMLVLNPRVGSGCEKPRRHTLSYSVIQAVLSSISEVKTSSREILKYFMAWEQRV